MTDDRIRKSDGTIDYHVVAAVGNDAFIPCTGVRPVATSPLMLEVIVAAVLPVVATMKNNTRTITRRVMKWTPVGNNANDVRYRLRYSSRHC
jgi:hypothetical protein